MSGRDSSVPDYMAAVDHHVQEFQNHLEREVSDISHSMYNINATK